MLNLTDSEKDIQLVGIKLVDYLRDLIILSGRNVPFNENYMNLRNHFGDGIVELVRFIRVADAEYKRSQGQNT